MNMKELIATVYLTGSVIACVDDFEFILFLSILIYLSKICCCIDCYKRLDDVLYIR